MSSRLQGKKCKIQSMAQVEFIKTDQETKIQREEDCGWSIVMKSNTIQVKLKPVDNTNFFYFTIH